MELWHLILKHYKASKKADWFIETFGQIVEAVVKDVVPDVKFVYDCYKYKYVFKSESRKNLKIGRDLLNALIDYIPQELFAKKSKNKDISVGLLILKLFDSEVILTDEEYETILKKLKTILVLLK